MNLACSIICRGIDVNISLPVRYSYLSILSDDKADISVVFLLILYYSFSFLIWSLSWFYYIFKKKFLNLKGLPDASVASLTKKEYGSAVHFFVDLNETFRVNVWWMI